jgi:hypothetical protein
MYGMVNRAIQDLVCGNSGEEAWEQIKTVSGVDAELFVRNETYPDDVTYRLVDAAGADHDEFLVTWGEAARVATQISDASNAA